MKRKPQSAKPAKRPPGPPSSESSESSSTYQGANAAALFGDVRLLLYLFVGFRLIALLVYQPALNTADGIERGITVYGDYQYHFGMAENAARDLWPYRDFWYEYPPVIPLLSQAVYALSGANFTSYANLLALLLLAFDMGNLLLVRRLGARLHGAEVGSALAWLYALMIAPFVLLFWNFEAVVTFSLLLAASFLIERRDTGAALALAFGALVKLVPLVALGAVWRFRVASAALRSTALTAGITAAGLGGVLLLGAEKGFGWPSLAAQFNKASHQTVWALLDGNFSTGVFSNNRLDPAVALNPAGRPPLVPWWLRTLIFGALGGLIFATTQRFDASALLAFIAVALVLFYLWSPGWSPQWQAALVPLILLTLPNRSGALLCMALALLSFVEYPLIFERGVVQGTLDSASVPIFALTVLARTALLFGFGALVYGRLRAHPRARSDSA